MLHLLKLFWFVVKELLFDTKEEYDFRSQKFNSKKVMAALALMLSFFLNIWLLDRFYTVSTSYMEVKKKHSVQEEDITLLRMEGLKCQSELKDTETLLRQVLTKHRPIEKKASQPQIK